MAVTPSVRRDAWNGGCKTYFATGTVIELAVAGELPYYLYGVSTRVIPDDGRDGWMSLHERALEGHVWVHEEQENGL